MKYLLAFLLLFAQLTQAGTSPHELRLRALSDNFIAARDTRAYFASIYLVVTKGLTKKVARQEFRENECMERLIAEFLNMYFAALDNPISAPEAWREAFRTNTKPSIHLLLGLNAHITHDLPLSMWQVSQNHPICSAQNLQPDYFSLNSFFTDLIPALNEELKKTHARMNENKDGFIQLIANKTIGAYVIHMRNDAWNDFTHLEEASSREVFAKQVQKIERKSVHRARFYKTLRLVAPATGF
jgi:hypothetical protein